VRDHTSEHLLLIWERLDRIEIKLDHILHLSQKTYRLETTMATDLTALTDAVAKDTEVDAAAVTLLENLATMLADAKTDPAAIQAIADSLLANSDALAAAVVANTPAA
jgi:hypothetical protein